MFIVVSKTITEAMDYNYKSKCGVSNVFERHIPRRLMFLDSMPCNLDSRSSNFYEIIITFYIYINLSVYDEIYNQNISASKELVKTKKFHYISYQFQVALPFLSIFIYL